MEKAAAVEAAVAAGDCGRAERSARRRRSVELAFFEAQRALEVEVEKEAEEEAAKKKEAKEASGDGGGGGRRLWRWCVPQVGRRRRHRRRRWWRSCRRSSCQSQSRTAAVRAAAAAAISAPSPPPVQQPRPTTLQRLSSSQTRSRRPWSVRSPPRGVSRRGGRVPTLGTIFLFSLLLACQNLNLFHLSLSHSLVHHIRAQQVLDAACSLSPPSQSSSAAGGCWKTTARPSFSGRTARSTSLALLEVSHRFCAVLRSERRIASSSAVRVVHIVRVDVDGVIALLVSRALKVGVTVRTTAVARIALCRPGCISVEARRRTPLVCAAHCADADDLAASSGRMRPKAACSARPMSVVLSRRLPRGPGRMIAWRGREADQPSAAALIRPVHSPSEK